MGEKLPLFACYTLLLTSPSRRVLERKSIENCTRNI